MIYIAICDDNKASLELLHKIITKEFQLQNQEFSIKLFSSCESIEESISQGNNYDVLFLDVDLNDGNGIALAKRLRQKKITSFIVFITNYEKYVFPSFQVQPFRFIRKARFSLEIRETVKALCFELSEKPINYVVFQDNYNLLRLDSSQIIYVESAKQLISIVTIEKTYSIKYKMMDAENLLAQYGFIRIHKGYLVNASYINVIQKEQLILDSGDNLPVSRYRVNDVKTRFMELSYND